MLRLRGPGLVLGVLLFACAPKEDPEPLASYGSARLSINRSTDIHGTPILFAYLFPRDSDDCPPLAEVNARIDGRTLAVHPGGGPGTCFGATFKAPLVVLSQNSDFHELVIEDETAAIRARIADLRSDARLTAHEDGDVVRLRFDRALRGHVEAVRATWSGTVPAGVSVDGEDLVAELPADVKTSGRVVLSIDAFIRLDVAECEGIDECRAVWFFHEVLDVALTR